MKRDSMKAGGCFRSLLQRCLNRKSSLRIARRSPLSDSVNSSSRAVVLPFVNTIILLLPPSKRPPRSRQRTTKTTKATPTTTTRRRTIPILEIIRLHLNLLQTRLILLPHHQSHRQQQQVEEEEDRREREVLLVISPTNTTERRRLIKNHLTMSVKSPRLRSWNPPLDFLPLPPLLLSRLLSPLLLQPKNKRKRNKTSKSIHHRQKKILLLLSLSLNPFPRVLKKMFQKQRQRCIKTTTRMKKHRIKTTQNMIQHLFFNLLLSLFPFLFHFLFLSPFLFLFLFLSLDLIKASADNHRKLPIPLIHSLQRRI